MSTELRDAIERAIITPVVDTVRVPLRRFLAEMEAALRRKDPERGRRGWEHLPVDWLYTRAVEEMGEAIRAVRFVRASQDAGAREAFCVAAQRELADAANFLMMIHDRIEDYRCGRGVAP